MNLRPAVPETAALPTALHPDVLMLPTGFEPAIIQSLKLERIPFRHESIVPLTGFEPAKPEF